jgi:hypothetical protein
MTNTAAPPDGKVSRKGMLMRKKYLAIAVVAAIAMNVLVVSAASAEVMAGVNVDCRVTIINAACQQLNLGNDRYVPDRGTALVFTCSIAVPETRVLAVTIKSCTARGLTTGETVSGFQNGTQTPTSATAGVSTTGDLKEQPWQLCQVAEVFTIQGGEELEPYCNTIYI